jgi:hypothetical protein
VSPKGHTKQQAQLFDYQPFFWLSKKQNIMNINTNNNSIKNNKKPEQGLSLSKGSIKRSALAKKLLIKGENLKHFEALRLKILGEILIHTEIENILVEKFISSAWKLERAGEIERNLLNEQNQINEYEEPSSWGSKKKRVRNIKKVRLFRQEIQHIIQYQLDLEKAMQKSLERLREEQALNASKTIIREPKVV